MQSTAILRHISSLDTSYMDIQILLLFIAIIVSLKKHLED